MSERLSDIETKGREKGTEKPDLLSMFLKAQTDRPEFMTDQRVLTMAVSMAFAGSETTAISLAATFYYLLRNPRCYEKLMQELNEAVEEGRVEDRPTGTVTWAESQNLPYLDACIKESFRMHPAAGLPLERLTPPQGIEIDGQFIPGGTIVGCNAWVIHKREEVFGSQIDSFIPERWLDVGKEQLKEMNGTLFQFGAGARTCIGKNISLLEMYKLVPAFLRRFEVSYCNPDLPEMAIQESLLTYLVSRSVSMTPAKTGSCITVSLRSLLFSSYSKRQHLLTRQPAWFVKEHDFYCRFKARKLR